MKINTLLIANRGEIACRIARTARALGITPVGVHSEADANALHVREIGRSVLIGGAPASESYLRVDAVIEAARKVGADAIHPGYGFLAENPDFADAVEAAGMIFVGPTAETLRRFGDKASAKAAALASGVRVIPGAAGAQSDPASIAASVREMGFPVLLKAVGGGGGRGQRLVETEAGLMQEIESALREAKSTFGSDGLLLERLLPEARHIEVQIAGDGRGQVVHLFERDCTLQRRHQKVIEEAPAWGLPRTFLDRIAADAVKLGKSLDYRGLGTVEFLVTGEEHFFLEVNPRIQVEHPVTEAITGLDLVALQLRIATGDGLGLTQADLACHGHAMEARLYAEDPANSFAPSTGTITALSLPEGIRVDSGVERGDSVSPFYDPMIAKLIVHAEDRETALARLAKALDHTIADGVETNLAFLKALTSDPAFGEMRVHTRWIDAQIGGLMAARDDPAARLWRAVAAVLFVAAGREDTSGGSWMKQSGFTGWRLASGDPSLDAGQPVTLEQAGPGAQNEELRIGPIGKDGAVTVVDGSGRPIFLTSTMLGPGRWQITHADEVLMVTAQISRGRIEMATPSGRYLFHAAPPLAFAAAQGTAETTVTSPLTGMIVEVVIADGDPIAAGDVVAVLESMKMEISIKAASAGIATNVSVSRGMMVDRGQTIAEIIPQESEPA